MLITLLIKQTKMQNEESQTNLIFKTQQIGAGVLTLAIMLALMSLERHSLGDIKQAVVEPLSTVAHNLEKESETARHMVRIDNGMRLTPTSGSGD
jgi:hypothetical protein